MDRMPDSDPMDKEAPLSGLDPAALLRQGVSGDTFMEGMPGSSGLPPLEEIAAAFPQFEILGLIGQGGMGAVYKVRQRDLDRVVALKILPPSIGRSPEFSERFTREARALAKLNHPGIVTIHEFGQREGHPYILMEFVDGVNLAQLMKSGRVSPREALAIVPQICDALQYAHDQGIVHRDIKPENILLDRLGRVKVADFGIAKVIASCDPEEGGEAVVDGNQTIAGKVMGTPQYMAPEQVDRPGEVDHRADIYALGVVLYQMLTGELPGKDFQAPSQKLRIDVRLDEIVLHALEKEPSLRYQSAGEFRTRVETVVSDMGGTPPTITGPDLPAGSQAAAHPSAGSRFSRVAIAGACWAPLFFLVLLFWLSQKPVAIAGPGEAPPAPALWQTVLAFTLLPLGLAAPFGTTILGWISVTQIRRSAGGLRGLWLAVTDGLLFPLLLMAGLIACFWHWVFHDLIRAAIVEGAPELSTLERLLADNTTAFTVLATLVISLVAGFFIIRSAWRAVNATNRSLPRKGMSGGAIAIGCGLLGIGVIILVVVAGASMVWMRKRSIAGAEEFRLAHQVEVAAARERAERLAEEGKAGLALLTDSDSKGKSLSRYDWKALAADGRLEAGELVTVDGRSCLRIENLNDEPMNARLLTITNPPIKAKRYAVMGEIRYENVQGAAYLEMWNDFPRGRFFSRTMDESGSGPTGQITGTSGWRPFSLPFDQMRVANTPNRIEVNLHLPGKGTVFIGPLELIEIKHGADAGAETSSPSIDVSGEVRNAGSFQIASPASLLDAVAAAGGWSEKADLSKVFLKPPGQSEGRVHDVTAILRGEAVNPVVVPGTTVFVPEK